MERASSTRRFRQRRPTRPRVCVQRVKQAPRGARRARRTFAMSYGGDGTLLETRERFCEKPGSNGFESRLDAAVLSAVLLFSMTLRKSITHAVWAARPCLLKRCDRPRLRVWRPLFRAAGVKAGDVHEFILQRAGDVSSCGHTIETTPVPVKLPKLSSFWRS